MARLRLQPADEMAILLAPLGFEREVRFHDVRRFRFDFARRDIRLAVEVDGGAWSGGRHVRGAGFARDLVKMNLAVEGGWRVLRYTPAEVRDGSAVEQVRRVMAWLKPNA